MLELKLRRGDLVTASSKKDKIRPFLVIQSEQFDTPISIVMMPITSTITPKPLLRVSVQPSDKNKLKEQSEIMIDKIMTVNRKQIKEVFGHIEEDVLSKVDERLAVFLGLHPFS